MKQGKERQKNTYIFRALAFIVFVFALFFMPKKTLAAWNPSQIIPDEQFIASTTMDEGQIQAFLNSKGGYLAGYHIPAGYTDSRGYYNGTLIGLPGKEVDATGWSTAKLIYETTKWYGINPQVVLATLEKEQSIVTTRQGNVTEAELARRIRWAMGYAVTDTGIVSACKTSTNSNPTGSCAGLAMQIDWATWQLKNKYNNPNPNFPVGSTVRICYTYLSPDCSNTYISNRATSSLYSYTPYFHGNYNFYTLMGLWFTWEPWEKTIYNLTVSSSLVTTESQLANPDPLVGQKQSAGFVLSNNNGEAVVLENVGVAARDSWGNNIDFGWYGPVTLAPKGQAGDYVHFNTPQRTERFDGPHVAWVSFKYQGNFFQATSLTGDVTSLEYINRVPNIHATSLFTANPAVPVANEVATYSTTIKNGESKRIYYDHMGFANRNMANGGNADIGWLVNGYIEPNEVKNVSLNRRLPSGSYFAWASMHIGAGFYEIWDGANVNHLNFEVVPLVQKLPITVALSLSDNAPAIGEEVTATYTIQNQTGSNFTFQKIGVANRGPGWSNQDYPWLQNVTVGANSSYIVTVKRINTELGDYIAWPAFQYSDSWYSPSGTVKSYNLHQPNIKATSLIGVNPSQPSANQAATYTVSIKNNEGKRIYFSHLGLANRSTVTGANSDLGWLASNYLEPGETKNLSFLKSLPVGDYFAWSSIHIGTNFYQIWDGANVNHVYFAVR